MSKSMKKISAAIAIVLCLCLAATGVYFGVFFNKDNGGGNGGGINGPDLDTNGNNTGAVVSDEYDLKDGVKSIEADSVKKGDDGYITIATESDIASGDIVLVENKETGLKEAYKIVEFAESNVGKVALVEKPELNEVYENLSYAGQQKMDADSDVQFVLNDETLNNGEIAMAAIEVFQSKPEIGGNVSKNDDGSLNLEITITVPNVVKVPGGSANLILKVNDRVSADAQASVFANSEDYGYDLKIGIYNDITCNVMISSGYNYTNVTNVNEIIQKLKEFSEKTSKDDGGIEIPAFIWTLPIANGAASITYAADVVFRFNFSGVLDVETKADLNIVSESGYSKSSSFRCDTYVTQDSGVKSVTVSLDGSVKVRAGIANKLTLDILAGVLSAGVKAELGLYNNLYGSVKTNNLLGEHKNVSAGLYSEGGFYYDVDLILAVSIGTIINTGTSIDLAAGDIELYNTDSRYLVRDITVDESYPLTAYNNAFMDITLHKYDLVTGNEFSEKGKAEIVTVGENSGLTVADGSIIVDENVRNDAFSADITIGYGQFERPSKIEYNGSFIVLDSVLDYYKCRDGATITVKGNGVNQGIITVTDENGNELDAVFDGKETIDIDARSLCGFAEGTHTLTVSNGEYNAYVTLNVSGTIGLFDFTTNSNAYDIFTAEQMIEFLGSGDSYAGMEFEITGDISLRGAALAPKTVFEGTLKGNGHRISDYNVTSDSERTALIATNKGTISDVAFGGVVNFKRSAKIGKTYYVAGVVATNEGVIENVTYDGTVNMHEKGVNVGVDIYVGGVLSNSAIEGCDSSNATLNLSITIDRHIDVYYDGSITNENITTANTAGLGVFVNFEKY